MSEYTTTTGSDTCADCGKDSDAAGMGTTHDGFIVTFCSRCVAE